MTMRGESGEPGRVLAAAGFDPRNIETALTAFERNTLWLLLSIIHYGWRAHADMAYVLVIDHPGDEAEDATLHMYQHRSLAALEEVFLLVDELCRMVRAIESHLRSEAFLDAYCQQIRRLSEEYERLKALSRQDWALLLPVPDCGELVKRLGKAGVAPELASEMLDVAEGLHTLCVTNMAEIAAFFERAPSPVADKTNCSLRDMSNSYRHGTKVLYEDCSPVEIGSVVTNPEGKVGTLLPASQVSASAWPESVDILMEPPDSEGRAFTAKARYSREWNTSVVRATVNLGVLLRRLVVALLDSQVRGEPGHAALAPVIWTPPPRFIPRKDSPDQQLGESNTNSL